ncbi:arginine--tRNA ligase [Streptococcus mutans]|jgi:arginyl-tRNA synthetase|uniref:Arginine--tRNA ligase n=1 Tax=Streptococcus mutans serotype c (strain ATCC 700610 / UA159) TaxID=210007 RepID=SYR_STRMU|nr:arginine--tRNA ligase [Streptococcus mutans]Q8DRW2.1 RecName: Full=Arginine--tRNA ligase; AltName: Full=Arginyl-tRNA synthetase; Short=ArgRS [Streptococcus mutans UA159]AAN59692.1 putative arginyl-tRNA synthase [Streptococcus mutans UA159]AJD56284.1 arginyl-tRNA synthetase [Streptococcus mutans UA159-FR]EMB61599.1 arginyl-tRNA synthetase [Streptococcus mutans 8ID3]EMB83112.1 arginyl-tRNA synthetase [Streptococcus mutans NFSM2]EMC15802.1 arginyl-tRNA synthetase [Streptococcus mutans N66]
MNHNRLIAKEIAAIVPALEQETILNLLEKPKKSSMGDLAFPTFSLAKTMRKAPQIIASELVGQINNSYFEKVEAVGPYINFFLNKSEISAQVLKEVIKKREDYAQAAIGQGHNIVIDLSSPNIAKPFSIGHLRSTVIGDALSNIFQKLGYETVKINHLGDWGKQFGMLIVAYKKWGSEEAVRAHPIDELLKIYVRINAETKNHPELDEEAREWFRKLENNDEEALALWQWFRDESLMEFNRLYAELGIDFDSYNGEAFYNDKMEEVVQLLAEKGLLEESKGAQVVNLEKYGIEHPALIKKSDGATLYITRDLAAAIYRKRTYDFAKAIYVVGQEQTAHFKQLKAVLAEMGYAWSKDIQHVSFGLVTKNGQKLSTRKGNVILLEPTIAEAVKRSLAQIDTKNPDLVNKEAVAHAVGVGAIKFYDLKTDRTNGYDFDLEAMVSFEGETGPYVQYAHARIQSILRKADFQPQATENYQLNDTESWEIIKLIQDFPNTIVRAADNFEPSLIARFAIHLAQSFNKYYAHTRILDNSPERDSRLALSYATATVLKEALALLGVEAPNEM